MIQGLYQTLPRIPVPDPEYPCGDGTNLTQIVRVPYYHPHPGQDRSLGGLREEALKKAVDAIDRLLWMGQKHVGTEGGCITRLTDGLLSLSSRMNFRWDEIRVAELRPLIHLDHSDVVHTSLAGEYIWEGGLFVPVATG